MVLSIKGKEDLSVAFLTKRADKGGVYYIRHRKPNGKMSWKSTGSKAAYKAELELAKFLRAQAKGVASEDIGVSSFRERLEEYLSLHRSPHTKKQRLYYWDQWAAWAGIHRVGHATGAMAKEWRDHLLSDGRLGHKTRPQGTRSGGGYSRNTVRTAMANVSAVYHIAIAELKVFSGPNPFDGVEPPEFQDSFPAFHSIEELDAIMAEAAGDRDMLLAIALGAMAGLRKGEIDNARAGWIERNRRRWHIHIQADERWRPKGKKPRKVPVSDELRAIIEEHVKTEDSRAYIVRPGAQARGQTEYRWDFAPPYNTLCKRAGVESSPHKLRHTFASQLAMSGVSLYKIQMWLGHQDPKTTMIYAHLQDDDDEINYRGARP